MEEKIICPVCGSKRIEFYTEKNNYKLHKCLDCDLVFVFPLPDNLDSIYKEEYFKNDKKSKGFGYVNYEKDKEPMRVVFVRYLKRLEKMTEGRNIFDVGAATGYFLDLAHERGWKTYGSEISEYAAGLARKKDHTIFLGDLVGIKLQKGIDAVTMWDILEHLDNPIEYMKIINKILKPGGRLVINTIDRGSLWARFWGREWNMIIPPEHLFYYSRQNLKILLERTGFKIIETKKIGKKFSLSYIFKTLYVWQDLS